MYDFKSNSLKSLTGYQLTLHILIMKCNLALFE
jgi:hypothetical protein